jgi:hypothetical protein
VNDTANSGSDEPEPHTLYLHQLRIFDHIFDWQQALPAASPNTKEHNQPLNPNVTQTAGDGEGSRRRTHHTQYLLQYPQRALRILPKSCPIKFSNVSRIRCCIVLVFSVQNDRVDDRVSNRRYRRRLSSPRKLHWAIAFPNTTNPQRFP